MIEFRASAAEGAIDAEHAVYIAWYVAGTGGYAFVPLAAAEKLAGDLTKAIADARAIKQDVISDPATGGES